MALVFFFESVLYQRVVPTCCTNVLTLTFFFNKGSLNLYQVCHDSLNFLTVRKLYLSGSNLAATNMANKRSWNEVAVVQDALAFGVCVTCGQRPPNPNHASCCRGCAQNSLDGCDCASLDAQTSADAPTFLLCSSCHVKTANVDDGFDTCCQPCVHGMCTCCDGHRDVPRGARGIRVDDVRDYDQMLQVFPGVQPVGMNATEIATLPSWPAKDDSRNCPICQEEVITGQLTLNLPCLHGFHEQCLIPWLQKHASCPICKTATK